MPHPTFENEILISTTLQSSVFLKEGLLHLDNFVTISDTKFSDLYGILDSLVEIQTTKLNNSILPIAAPVVIDDETFEEISG